MVCELNKGEWECEVEMTWEEIVEQSSRTEARTLAHRTISPGEKKTMKTKPNIQQESRDKECTIFEMQKANEKKKKKNGNRMH